MRTMVRFSVGGTAYCLPVECTRAVRAATGMIALPSPRDHVVGLLPGDPPLTVLSPFGSTGGQVVVIETDTVFGLLVDAVTSLCHVAEDSVRTAPQGQLRTLLSGSVEIDGQLVLLADPVAMAVGM